jgi:PhnB protein
MPEKPTQTPRPMAPTRTPALAPYLAARGVPELVRFLEEGLGGRVSFEEKGPDGRLAHVEVRIADGLVMLGEAPPERAPFPAMVHLYVPDADAAYARALHAGATSVRPPAVAPDGLRRGGVRDRWGNEWWVSQLPR